MKQIPTLIVAALLPVGAGVMTMNAQQAASPPSIERAQMLTSVKSFGARGDGRTDDSAAIQAALDRAPAGTTLFFPVGDYLVTRDLVLRAERRISIEGEGQNSLLRLQGAALRVTGVPDINSFRIERLRILRHRQPGIALQLDGDKSAGVSRFALRDLLVESQGGTAISVEGAWIGMFDNIVTTKSYVGWHFHRDPRTRGTSANAMTIMGGESHANADAMIIEGVLGLTMVGHAVEGNQRGLTLRDGARHVSVTGGYFEANRDYDMSIGAVSSGYGHTISGNVFLAASRPSDHAILLNRDKNIRVEGNSFVNYRSGAMRVADQEGTNTIGFARDNHLTGTPRQVTNAGARKFEER